MDKTKLVDLNGLAVVRAWVEKSMTNKYGAPLIASSVSAMSDRTRVYVYTGTTSGTYVNGHWYFWDGSSWSDGGSYNSAAVNVDKTLSQEDVPADAKIIGDALSAIGSESLYDTARISATTTISISDHSFTNESITTGGIRRTASNRISSEPIYIRNGYHLQATIASGYKVFFTEYDAGMRFVRYTDWKTSIDNYLQQGSNGGFLVLTFARTNDADLSPTEATAAMSTLQVHHYDLSEIGARRTDALSEQAVQFTFSAYNKVDTRAASPYLAFEDDLVIDLSGAVDMCIAVTVYDSMLNAIYSTDYSNNAHVLELYKSKFPDGRFYTIHLANASDSTQPLTRDLVDQASKVCRIRRILPEPLDTLTASKLYPRMARDDTYGYYSICYGRSSRAFSKGYFVNEGQLLTLQDRRFDFYVRYYDSSFAPVIDTSWSNRYIDLAEQSYPYFGIAVRMHTDSDELTDALLGDFVNAFDCHGSLSNDTTITGTGELTFGTSDIRSTTPRFLWIEDAYIKLLNVGYDYGVSIYDKNKTYVKSIGWFTYSTDFGAVDRALRLQKCFVRFYFAKLNRTDSFTVADYIDIQRKYQNGELLKIVESVAPQAIGTEIQNGYPLYYESEVDATANSICSNIGPQAVVFAMVTDLHDNDHNHYPEVLDYQLHSLKALKEKTRLDFVVCGGDLTDGGYSSKEELLSKFTDHRQHFANIGVPSLFLRGNHDDNSYYSTNPDDCITREEFYARLIGVERKNTVPTGLTYYYHDFEDLNLRCVCLDYIDYPWIVSGGTLSYHASGSAETGVWRGYSDEQVAWLASEALNTNKRIVIFTHYSTHPNLMSTWEKQVGTNYTAISEAMIAYNNRSTFTFDGHTYDFGSASGKILLQVSGHSHAFGAFVDDGIVWSTTGSPSAEVTHRTHDDTQYETMGSRTYGDITEAHYNLFVCDTDNVHIISFGQMGDLNFQI